MDGGQARRSQGKERRKYERIEKRLGVRYGRLESYGAAGLDREGELLDISGGGLCFLADDPLELGSQVVVSLGFPGWKTEGDTWIATKNDDDVGTVKVVGMVVWVAVSRVEPGRFDIGLQFSGIIRG